MLVDTASPVRCCRRRLRHGRPSWVFPTFRPYWVPSPTPPAAQALLRRVLQRQQALVACESRERAVPPAEWALRWSSQLPPPPQHRASSVGLRARSLGSCPQQQLRTFTATLVSAPSNTTAPPGASSFPPGRRSPCQVHVLRLLPSHWRPRTETTPSRDGVGRAPLPCWTVLVASPPTTPAQMATWHQRRCAKVHDAIKAWVA